MQQQAKQQTMQREYKGRRQMRRGIQHEANHGWRVVGTVTESPGCMRRLAWGWFARNRYIVTFTR